ncbi:MAG: glycosyltransferase [Candidatus Competibacteraceae bacterium]|nr:glycosyltransferase [Candidatus Competibacteraceae bacterium]
MAKKIMYLVDYYENLKGGTESQLNQLIQYLDRSRYEPNMMVFKTSDYIEKNTLPCPVKILGFSKLLSVKTILKIWQHAFLLKKDGYCLVHCYFNDSTIVAPFFMKLAGLCVIVSRRDMGFWYTPINLLLLRWVSRFVDAYVANSQAVKLLVQKKEWISTDKIKVIYNGFEPVSLYKSKIETKDVISSIPSDVPIIGIVANLRPIKRIDVLVNAFILVNEYYPKAYLMIVGDEISEQASSTFKELKKIINNFVLKDRVIFTGAVDDPRYYIEKFTIAVLCSESEGFSNSIIEYMQARKPIVCTNTGGNPEIIKDNYNGFLVPVGDTKALANRLVQLLSNNALAYSLGEAAYETVSIYTHSRMVNEHMNFYDKILSSPSKETR